jgi:VWFA-related protein
VCAIAALAAASLSIAAHAQQTAPPASNTSPSTPAPSAQSSPAVQAQADEMATHTSQTPFQSSVNLVPVRVVVRDGNGKVVTNLQRENFQVFQDGKPQIVAHFSVLTSESAQPVVRATPANADAAAAAGDSSAAKLELPARFVAILFDDVHLEMTDSSRVRIAADKYIDTVKDPTTRFALYTTSGQFQTDFSDDIAALHKTINSLMPRPVGAFAINQRGQCPNMDHYEADLIVNQNDPTAIAAAEQDTMVCANLTSATQAYGPMQATAMEVLQSGDFSTQYSLRRLDEILKRLASLPGQRSIVLVSPGFLVNTNFLQDESKIIDRAEHDNIFINTLDARGLYTVDPIGDITQDVPAYASSQTAGQGSMYRTMGAMANDYVMRDLAAGTGGVAFINNNDLYAGLERTAGKPETSYLLAYNPIGLKNDGKFHNIKVKLAGTKEKYSVQARRGFFAPKKDATPEDVAKQDIEEAVFSQEEQAAFPLDLHLQYFATGTGTAKVTVMAHVGVDAQRFEDHDGRHWDDLTVVVALFDRNGNFLQGDEKTLEMRLKDPTLARVEKSGVTIRSEFDVHSGGYLVRLVVRDRKSATVATKNGVVEIP